MGAGRWRGRWRGQGPGREPPPLRRRASVVRREDDVAVEVRTLARGRRFGTAAAVVGAGWGLEQPSGGPRVAVVAAAGAAEP